MTFTKATVVGSEGLLGPALAEMLGKKGLTVHSPGPTDDAWRETEQGLLLWNAMEMGGSPADSSEVMNAHGLLLAEVLAAGRYDGLVYITSTRPYEGLTGLVNESTPLRLDPSRERELGDLCRAMGEWLVLHQGGPNARVARISRVYGDRLDGGSFLEEVLARALEGKGGSLATSPDAARDYIHLEDACRAVWAIANEGRSPVYLVASGETVDNQTLLGLLHQRTSTEFMPELPPLGRTAPTFDVGVFEREMNFRPRPLIEGLDRVLTWQENQRAMRSMMGVTQMPWM